MLADPPVPPAKIPGLLKILALLIVLFGVLSPRLAEASRPVITPGREDEIAALFVPYELGDELDAGWTLHSFSIDVSTIVIWIEGPKPATGDRPYAQVTLDHPDFRPKQARELPGFAVAVVEQPEGSEAAVEELIATIERNDSGQFWSIDPVWAEEPSDPLAGSLLRKIIRWGKDGVLLYCWLLIALIAYTIHKLRGSPRWIKWALPAIVIAALGLRLWLSPKVALAPWPYTRFLVSARLLYEGPTLALAPIGPVWMSETVTTSTLMLAALAPLAVFIHARYLLDDYRAALIVAGVVAILPLHLRFSHSDAAFIPSITVSSVAFALVHAATREPSKAWGWISVILLGFPIALMYQVRPLNIMYFPLFLATAFVNEGLRGDKPVADRKRMIATFLIITGVTFGIGVPWLLEGFGDQVNEGLSFETITSAFGVLFSPRMNALLNPEFTPPGLTLLAVVGAVDLWRRRRRRLFAFIVLWLLGFLVAHAYVVPVEPYMQARYHLHLIVPYMLLVACGLEATITWLLARREAGSSWLSGRRLPVAIALIFAYVAASPLIHMRFIRKVEFNDAREWIFVHSLREAIPPGCTVLEYGGRGADSRFERVGAYTKQGMPRSTWMTVDFPMPAEGEPELTPEVIDLLHDPPECLYWYEGLPCFGNKPSGEHKAPGCAAVEGFHPLEEVAATRFESHVYDSNLGMGLEQGEPIQLTLYRVRPRE